MRVSKAFLAMTLTACVPLMLSSSFTSFAEESGEVIDGNYIDGDSSVGFVETPIEVESKSLLDILQVDTIKSEDGTFETYTFSCEVEEGCPFTHFSVYKIDESAEDKSIGLYTEPFEDISNVLDRSCTFTENGNYEVLISALGYDLATVYITVDSIVPQVVMQDDFVDNTAPEIYLDVSDVSGLTQGDIFNFGVSTNEECTIRVGTDVFNNTTQATGTAYGNGSIDVVAVDSWGNMSTAVVNITAFGDGYISPPRKSHKNDNPLTKVDKESYWGLAAMGSLDGAAGDGSSSSSDKITKLPQTGVATVGIFAGLTALAGVGAVLMVKFRKGKKGVVSDEE